MQAGLIDLYVNTAYSGNWVISVDGVESYITEGTNICGPWASWVGRNAGTAPAVSAQPVVSAPELAASAEATAELTSALGLLDGIQTFFFPSDGKKKMASVMLQSLNSVILWNCGWMLIAVCLVVINSACSQVYISPT